MGWNIDHKDFDNIVIQGNNLNLYAGESDHITVWVGEEIKKVTWRSNAIIVYLKSGQNRLYLNHMHYVILQPTVYQKTRHFIDSRLKMIISHFPKFSRQRAHGKYGISPSANISR
jgi:hypothetical protein